MSDPEPMTLDGLHERHRSLTPALAQSYVEAAYVCLARHHQSPVVFSVNHAGNGHRRRVSFPAPDDRTRNAHANEIDATEAGAYGVSLAAVESVLGMLAVKRAETLTGADWYIPDGEMVEDLERCVRLEVSGINAGSSGDVNNVDKWVSRSMEGSTARRRQSEIGRQRGDRSAMRRCYRGWPASSQATAAPRPLLRYGSAHRCPIPAPAG